MATQALRLFRRYVTDFVNRHDFSVLGQIMCEDYTLETSGLTICGRDTSYRDAVARQMEQFPGLMFTVHELFVTPTAICIRFTEHGASVRHGGARAAWSSIAIYDVRDNRLSRCTIEQDYFSRHRQLSGKQIPTLDPPAIAPWDETEKPPDIAAEVIVRIWLESEAWLDTDSAVPCDDRAAGQAQLIVERGTVTIDRIVSGAGQVAFHAVHRGLLADDFAHEAQVAAGTPAEIYMGGLVTVTDGRIIAGHIIRDRWGLYRRLQQQQQRQIA